jgi:ribosome-associated protein
MDLSLPGGVVVPEGEIAQEYSRSGGPGGQHVNKTETRVTLRWSVVSSPSLPDTVRQKLLTRLAARLTKEGELLVSVDTHRERPRNLALAFERLQGILQAALKEQKKRRATQPSRGSTERRLKAKRQASEKKQGRRSPSHD